MLTLLKHQVLFPVKRLHVEHATGVKLRALLSTGLLLFLTACATGSYEPVDLDSADFLQRQLTQTQGAVTVSAAVPDAGETRELTGLDLYAQGIQPVWLKIDNSDPEPVRLALWSLDSLYFSPIEVSYKNRKRFGSQGKLDMERWFHDNGMPREIPPGESRSGLVFTHLTPGTKGFNVDVFKSIGSHSFTFFVPIPGFIPDHMRVDFDSLYGDADIQTLDQEGLRDALANDIACRASDAEGAETGDPLNVVIVGTRAALRRTLLRGGWRETEASSEALEPGSTQYVLGRQPDGTFFSSRDEGNDKVELRLWMMPMQVDRKPVWLAQAGYSLHLDINAVRKAQGASNVDPERAQGYITQKFWYNHSLEKHGELTASGGSGSYLAASSGSTSAAANCDRSVLFVSEQPRAMDEVELIFVGDAGS